MKPPEGRYRTATQVKVLSPEITNIGRDDRVHFLEVSMSGSAMVSDRMPSRGLRPWYGVERRVQELGRPHRLREGGATGEPAACDSEHTSCLRAVRGHNRKGRKPEGRWGVGSAHSRGVAVVMRGEGQTHSKGLTPARKGSRRHRPHTEAGELW